MFGMESKKNWQHVTRLRRDKKSKNHFNFFVCFYIKVFWIIDTNEEAINKKVNKCDDEKSIYNAVPTMARNNRSQLQQKEKHKQSLKIYGIQKSGYKFESV